MFFILSKIFWAFAQPANLLLLLLVIAAVLLCKWPRAGRIFTIMLVVGATLVGILPIGEYLLRGLENKYPVPILPERVDGIICLAGFVWTEGSVAHNQIQVTDKADRLVEFIELAHKYPNAKLVFTGGSGDPLLQGSRESDWVRQAWTDMGLDPARVIWERDSRNTYENVVNSKVVVHPQPGENWVLITSAVHMPRSVAIFNHEGWRVIPYPVDYITTNRPLWQFDFSVSGNLWLLTEALKEIIGMKAYEATGKAD